MWDDLRDLVAFMVLPAMASVVAQTPVSSGAVRDFRKLDCPTIQNWTLENSPSG